MHRDKLTAKIERIIETIERGETPLRVLELHVFGSYRRGANECGDLDLIVVVEPATDELRARFGVDPCDVRTWGRIDTAVRRSLVRRGEKIQVLVCHDVSSYMTAGASLEPSDVLLLWADRDRRWREKLAAIEPDSKAGRYPRNHFIDLKRTGSDLATMEEVMWLLERKRLKLTREPMSPSEPRLPPALQDLVRRLGEFHRYGRETFRLLPYALDWLHGETRQPARSYWLDRTQLGTEDLSRRVHLGKISLDRMLYWLFDPLRPPGKVCLVPHIRRNQPNELLIFQRGARWNGDRNEYGNRRWKPATPLRRPRDTPF
jgi:hypothetical protein